LIIFVLSGCGQEAKKERHWKRGEQYFTENKFKEAIIEYKNVLQIDPKNVKTRYKLGLSHLRVGQFRDAFSEFSKCVELDQDLIDARL
jgi:tetratricopeptide (TPR) repeat protein